MAVVTSCTTNSAGVFPSSPGSCTFVVPLVSGGAQTLIASVVPASGGLGTIPVGVGPIGIAYDSGQSEVFAANQNDGTVSVVSDVTGAQVAVVAVGALPTGVAYDAAMGEIFVTNWGSNSVSVINDTTNAVVATVPVLNNPMGLAYDGGLGELFVANSNSNSVSVISDATNGIVATVPITSPCVGTSPWGVVDDPLSNEVFVTLSSGSVCAISTASNSPMFGAAVGSSPEGAALDTTTNEVWVANSGSNTLSVLDGSSGALVSTLATPPSPNDVAYDAAVGDIVTTSTGGSSPTMTVIDGVTRMIVNTATIGGAAGPDSVAYDSGMSEIMIADFNSNTLSVYPAGGSASATFTVSGSLVLSPSNGPSGTLISAAGSGLASSASVAFTFGGSGVSSTCSTNSTGSFPGGGTPCTFTAPTAPLGSSTVGAVAGAYSASTSFVVTAATLSLSPVGGPDDTLVTISGSGYAPNTAYGYCFRSVSGTPCSSGPSFTSTASGAIPSGAVISVPPSGNSFLDLSQSSSNFIISAAFTLTSATLSLSPGSGSLGTVVTLSGSGFADSTRYDYCFSSSAASTCGGTTTFISTGSGSIPSGATVVVPATSNSYVDVSQGSTNFILSSAFNATPTILTLTPATGPPGSLVALAGSGYAPSTSYTFCFGPSSTSPCSSGSNFISTSSGLIPASTTITLPSTTNHWVDLSQGPSTFIISASFTPTLATLRLSPGSGPPGASVVLSGSGFAPNVAYLFCLESSSGISCPMATTTSFTSSAGGAIPGGTAFIVPFVAGGAYYLDLSQGSAAANFIVAASFNVTSHLTLSPSSGRIGNSTTATGEGFLANATATLSWDAGQPTALGLNCASGSLSTSPSGSFACTFVVPLATVGPHQVTATTAGLLATATYVVNTTFRVLGAINPTSRDFRMVGQVPTGYGPTDVAWDADQALMFVTNNLSGTVSVFGVSPLAGGSVSLGSPLSISVGGYNPVGIAWDSAKDEMFVADYGGLSNGTYGFTVISDKTLNVTPEMISGSADPYAVAYAPALGEILVTDPQAHKLWIVNDTTFHSLGVTLLNGGVSATPEGVAYDSGHKEAFVADEATNRLFVVNLSTQSIFAIPVSDRPWGVAYDSGKGEIFVTQYLTGSVQVINDSYYVIVANFLVGPDPQWATYDNNASSVFVSSPSTPCTDTGGQGNITGINDTSNAVFLRIPVGGNPEGLTYDPFNGEVWGAVSCSNTAVAITTNWNGPSSMAYDSAKGELFVANTGPGVASGVGVFSDSSDQLLTTIPVGGPIEALAYDSGKGEIFASDGGSGTLQIINDTNDTVIGTVGVGSAPGDLVYDPATGEILVLNHGRGNTTTQLTAVSDTCNCLSHNVTGLGNDSYDLAYDSGTGEAFVTNHADDKVSVVSGTTYAVVGNVSVGANSSCTGIAYDPRLGQLDALCAGPQVHGILSSAVLMINDTTDSVVGEVVVSAIDDWGGNGPPQHPIAYDPASRAMLVLNLSECIGNGCLSSVVVLSDAFQVIVATVSISWQSPYNILADASAEEAVVANFDSGTLSLVSV